MPHRIIVDIDNTLWDFAPVLLERIRAVFPDFPPPPYWDRWDFWRPRFESKDLYEIIRQAHAEQDAYPCYEDAKPFLGALKESGFTVVIASHREKGTFGATERWLRRHDLPYDELHLSHDKTVLFGEAWGIVDDSPVTLAKARKAGIVRAGLREPWNRKEDHPLFDNLTEVLAYLRGQCTSGTGTVQDC